MSQWSTNRGSERQWPLDKMGLTPILVSDRTEVIKMYHVTGVSTLSPHREATNSLIIISIAILCPHMYMAVQIQGHMTVM